MAADKTHLQNLDKSYKLKKTDKLTTEGNPIYVNTETGEQHSELSVTIEYPENSGKWVNVPSLLNGRVYNAKGVLAMLKKGKLVPTSTHMDEQKASEAAAYRSTTLQSNTGESLKPNNELVVSTGIDAMNANIAASVSKLDNMSTGEKSALTLEILQDKAENPEKYESVMTNDFASTFPTEEENPNGLFVRAAQPAYTSGSGANADILAAAEAALASDQQTQRLGAIMDNQALEKQDDYYKYYPNSARNTDPNFSGTPQPERISDRATQYLDQSGIETQKAREDALKIGDLSSIMDRADAEKIDPTFFDASRPRTNIFGNNSFNDRNSIDEMLRGQGIVGDRRAIQNKDYGMTTSAADQAMFDAAYKQRNFPDAGPKTRQSNKPGVNAKNLNPDEQMQNSYNSVPDMMTNGPEKRQSNKPMFNFEYKPHMNPEQKANDNRNIKGLTPDYGKMPGFKLPTNDKGESTGNYWSADENSDFWKTDAGYQKAQETWGQNLPTFVKKPQRKDIDIDAIKKFFTSSR